MLTETLDRRVVRLGIGILVGLPLTAAALVGSIYGVVIGVGSLGAGNCELALLGMAAILAMLGVAGAWRRLLKTHLEMSIKERMVVRALLWCGVVSSVYLAVMSGIFIDTRTIAMPAFIALTLAGILFIFGTPK